jgi:hypothetical protein
MCFVELARELREMADVSAEACTKWSYTDVVDPEYLDGRADAMQDVVLVVDRYEKESDGPVSS